MKAITILIAGMLAALTGRGQFGSDNPTAIGLYYSPILSFLGRYVPYEKYTNIQYTPMYEVTPR